MNRVFNIPMDNFFCRQWDIVEMKTSYKYFLSLLFMSILASCSAPKEENTTPPSSSSDYSKDIANAIHEPLDKAKSMEKTLQDQAEQQKRDIEQSASQ